MGFNPLSFFDVGIWRDDHTLAARASVIAVAVLTLLLAVIVLLKGKVWTGLVGMFITPLLFVGRDSAVAAARAVGALAIRESTPQDAPGAGTGTLGCAGPSSRRSSGCST